MITNLKRAIRSLRNIGSIQYAACGVIKYAIEALENGEKDTARQYLRRAIYTMYMPNNNKDLVRYWQANNILHATHDSLV
jgi:hypothetical protein